MFEKLTETENKKERQLAEKYKEVFHLLSRVRLKA